MPMRFLRSGGVAGASAARAGGRRAFASATAAAAAEPVMSLRRVDVGIVILGDACFVKYTGANTRQCYLHFFSGPAASRLDRVETRFTARSPLLRRSEGIGPSTLDCSIGYN